MPAVLVLDTNAFSDRGMPYFLRHYGGRSILPALAAAELFVHHRRTRGLDAQQFLAFLRTLRVEVEPLDARLALLAVEAAGPAFQEDPADALIAAHALAGGRVLVTANVQDFPQVPRKVTPAALLRA